MNTDRLQGPHFCFLDFSRHITCTTYSKGLEKGHHRNILHGSYNIVRFSLVMCRCPLGWGHALTLFPLFLLNCKILRRCLVSCWRLACRCCSIRTTSNLLCCSAFKVQILFAENTGALPVLVLTEIQCLWHSSVFNPFHNLLVHQARGLNPGHRIRFWLFVVTFLHVCLSISFVVLIFLEYLQFSVNFCDLFFATIPLELSCIFLNYLDDWTIIHS